MDALEILDELGGVARRSELARGRANRRAIDAAVTDGQLLDLGGGWVARQAAPRAHVAAVRLNATITGVTAAAFYALPVLREPKSIHLAVPDGRGAHHAVLASLRKRIGAVTLHREPVWTPPPTRFQLPLAPPVEAMQRVLRSCGVQEAAVIIDGALRTGLVTKEELDRALRGRGSVKARQTLWRCDARSRSLIETLARLTLRGAGLSVSAGVVIPGVGEVDLVVEKCVVVECDGFNYHAGTREFREDRRRDRALAALGYTVLRFTHDDITNDPDIVVSAVRDALLVRSSRAPGGATA